MFGWEFPPFNSGGLGTACQGLTRGLANKGVGVTFVLPRRVPLDVDYLKVIYGDDSVVKTEYVINSILMPYHNSKNYMESKENLGSSQEDIYADDLIEEVLRYGSVGGEIALREEFDVIHAHDWLSFPSGINAKKASGKPLVVHVHATEFDRTGGEGINQVVYDIEREGMTNADLVIAVSNYTKKIIVEKYGIVAEKVRVVHNSIDFENYTLERASKLSEANKVVLFLGRLTLQKGPDYFVEAARRVLEHYPDVIFIVAGSGDMEKQIINKVADMGISDRILFAGFLRGDDVKRAYQMADLYVMPSVSEPFGITPLESIINNTPVLISKQAGVSEVLNHCLKVDFWDVDEMSNKIVAFLRYPELYQCLNESGRREIEGWSWDQPAGKCLDIYNEVLGEKKLGW